MKQQGTEFNEYRTISLALAAWLDRNPSLSVEEQVTLENHLQIVQLSYAAWVQRRILADQGANPDQGYNDHIQQ